MDPASAAEVFLEQNPEITSEISCPCGDRQEFFSHELLVSDFDGEKIYRVKVIRTCQLCGESKEQEIDITDFVLEQCGPEHALAGSGGSAEIGNVSKPVSEKTPFTAAYLQLVQVYNGFESGQVDSDRAMALVNEVQDHLESHMKMFAARDASDSGGAFAEVDDMIYRGLMRIGESSSLLQDYISAAVPGSLTAEERTQMMQLLEEGNSLVGAGRDTLLQFEEALRT